MKEKLNKYGLTTFKLSLTTIFSVIGFVSLIYVALTSNELFSYFYCLATVGFVLLPLALCVVFKWKMNTLFYVFFSLYAMGPLLGAVYNFYYFTSWWDILLHFMAGTVFAAVGAQIAYVLNKRNKTAYMLAAVFGVLLSIGIAVVWEFFEYASDTFLHSDMQADTIIYELYTKINRTDGLTDIYTNITDTMVNGQSLGIVGYLDIGLIDTMNDMIIETLGALLFFIYVIIDKNRHPLIEDAKQN